MAPNKLNINEKLTDGEIDLSMSDLQDVPVKEIATYKKAYALDLSNNRLTTLPNNFPTLTHITKLDLSKNELKELPDNFGNLSKLKYLDLYHNQLKHLPLSFSKLKDLRWLDLKDNPLVPTVAKIAGPCLDTKQCQVCAKEVINFFVQLQEQVDNELDLRQKQRQKQIEKNQQKKQEEKKNKKKEKNKIKKQTTSTAYLDEHINTSNTKKKYKSSSNVNSSTYSFSIWKWIFSGLIFSLFIVFCGISVNASWSTHLADVIKIGYLRFTQSLPEYLVPYTIQFENVVKTANVKTGEFLMEYSVVFKLITDKVIRYTHSIKEFVTNNVLSLL